MVYKVIDELCCEEREYGNIKDAYKDAFNHQGILLEISKDGTKTVLADFS